MPIKDNKSSTNVIIVLNANETGDGTVNSPGLDTANFDNGVTLLPIFVADGGSGSDVALTSVQNSDDDGVSDPYVDIPSDQLIGDLANFSGLTPVSDADVIKTLGVIGNKKFIRAVLVFANGTTNSDFVLAANAGVEVSPGDN